MPNTRAPHQLRPLNFDFHLGHHADGYCVARMGKTTVLCTARIENRVPLHLRGTSRGWISAEYAMLPNATHNRIGRTKSLEGGRSKEISRLIGRSLRAICQLSALGERQILIDCDVLHADGGTRTCAINGSYIALYRALKRINRADVVLHSPIAALSCVLIDGVVQVDPDYEQDSSAEADANFVLSSEGRLIECQVTAETVPMAPDIMQKMLALATAQAPTILAAQRQTLGLEGDDETDDIKEAHA